MRRFKFAFTLAIIAFLLDLISQRIPETFFRLYSPINRRMIQGLSRFSSLVPFSLFEILIYTLILSLIGYIGFTILFCLKHRSNALNRLKTTALTVASGAGILYFIFVVAWGLNYNRPSLATELDLYVTNRSTEELTELYVHLIERTNAARLLVAEDEFGIFTTNQTYQEIFARAHLGYDALASEKLPAIGGTYGLAKPILASRFLNHTFITGIYSPFTGEPNVNVAVPDSTLIFTTLHEMAHQRGYAREDEANFLAFLTAIMHPDPDFQYVGYLNALNYTRGALRRVAPDRVPLLNEQISEAVIRDILYVNDFWQRYEGRIQEVSDRVNNAYLNFNGIEEGVASYGLVVDLLLAYFFSER